MAVRPAFVYTEMRLCIIRVTLSMLSRTLHIAHFTEAITDYYSLATLSSHAYELPWVSNHYSFRLSKR